MLYANLSYLRRHPHLAAETMTPEVVHFVRRRLALFALIPAISVVVAFFSTRIALYLYFLMVVVHMLPDQLDRLSRWVLRRRS